MEPYTPPLFKNAVEQVLWIIKDIKDRIFTLSMLNGWASPEDLGKLQSLVPVMTDTQWLALAESLSQKAAPHVGKSIDELEAQAIEFVKEYVKAAKPLMAMVGGPLAEKYNDLTDDQLLQEFENTGKPIFAWFKAHPEAEKPLRLDLKTLVAIFSSSPV